MMAGEKGGGGKERLLMEGTSGASWRNEERGAVIMERTEGDFKIEV